MSSFALFKDVSIIQNIFLLLTPDFSNFLGQRNSG